MCWRVREEGSGGGKGSGGGRGRAGAPEIFHVGANTELHLTGGGDGTIRDIVQTQWTSPSSSRLGPVCVHWVPRARAHTNLPAHTRYSRKHPIVPSVRTRARAPHPDPASSSTSASSRLVRVCVHCTRERACAPTSPPRTHTAFEETPECTPARARAHAPAPPRQRSEPKQRMDTCAAIAIKSELKTGGKTRPIVSCVFFYNLFFLSSVSVPFFIFLLLLHSIRLPHNSPESTARLQHHTKIKIGPPTRWCPVDARRPPHRRHQKSKFTHSRSTRYSV